MKKSAAKWALVLGVTLISQTASADIMCVRTTVKNSKVTLTTRVSTEKCPRAFKKLFDISTLATSLANDGVRGPQGEQGLQGPQGAQGIPGPQGPVGNANIFSSEEVGPGFNGGSSLTNTLVFGIRVFSFNIPAPEITNEVIAKGQVSVYGRLIGYTTSIWKVDEWSALPISLTYQSGATTNTDTWTAKITPGNIEIQFVNNLNTYTSISSAHRFRYVVIPPAAS